MTYHSQPGSSPSADGDVVDLPYEPATPGRSIETFTLSSLIARGTADLDQLERIGFDLVIYCTRGSGRHEVDFTSVEVFPGRVVHIRPGQVHRWSIDYEAHLVLLRPLGSDRDWAPGAHVIDTDHELARDLEHIIGLADQRGRTTPLSSASLEAVRDLFIARLGLDQPSQQNFSARDVLYRDLERLLGQSQPPPRSVQECAQRLGCSARTLTRACRAAAGAGPKELLDQAIALEAQRQLTVGNATATSVAERLGFPELSHFTRFFRRVTGETPSAFVAKTLAIQPHSGANQPGSIA